MTSLPPNAQMTSGPGVPCRTSARPVPVIVHSERSGGLPLGVGAPPAPPPPPEPPPLPSGAVSRIVHVLWALPVVLGVSIGTSLTSGAMVGWPRANDSAAPPASCSDSRHVVARRGVAREVGAAVVVLAGLARRRDGELQVDPLGGRRAADLDAERVAGDRRRAVEVRILRRAVAGRVLVDAGDVPAGGRVVAGAGAGDRAGVADREREAQLYLVVLLVVPDDVRARLLVVVAGAVLDPGGGAAPGVGGGSGHGRREQRGDGERDGPGRAHGRDYLTSL